MNEWIKTKDKLPETSEILCLIWARDDYEFAWWHKSSNAWDSPDMGWINADEVKVWANLPKMPKI